MTSDLAYLMLPLTIKQINGAGIGDEWGQYWLGWEVRY